MEFLKLIQTYRTPIFDSFFEMVTYIGDEVFVIAALCIYLWCINKNLAYRIGFSFFGAGLLAQVLKITFRIERPWIRDTEIHPVSAAVKSATGYSFPSGHTQSVTSIFGAWALYAKKKNAYIISILSIILVGFSRMYLGVHTPTDVITSMLLTLFVVLIFNTIFNKIENNKKWDILVAIVVIAISLLSLLYARYKLITVGFSPALAADCFKSAGAGVGFGLGWFIERKYINYTEKASIKTQCIKLLVGMSVLLLLKIFLKQPLYHIIKDELMADFIRYFILVLWVLVLYPMIFKKLLKKELSSE